MSIRNRLLASLAAIIASSPALADGIDNGNGLASLTTGSTAITGGTDKQVLFNDAGVVQGNAGLIFTKGTGVLRTSSLSTDGQFWAGSGNSSTSIAGVGTVGNGSVNLAALTPIQWSGGPNPFAAGDTFLFRDAAGTLAQRNTTNAQRFKLYNTYTDASNGEWFDIDWITNANVATIGTNFNGTGVARNLRFNVGGVNKLDYGVTSSGSWTFPAPAVFTSYFVVGSGANTGITINSNNQGILLVRDGNGNAIDRVQFGGTTNTFPALVAAGPALAFRRADNTVGVFANLPAAAAGNEGAIYAISDSTTVTWGATVTGGGANHALIYSDGTNWTVVGK